MHPHRQPLSGSLRHPAGGHRTARGTALDKPSMTTAAPKLDRKGISLHQLGVISGLTAGVWLGAAEAPTKLVNIGLSPFTVSLCMVVGVFTARWTFPTLLKGTTYVAADLRSKKHL